MLAPASPTANESRSLKRTLLEEQLLAIPSALPLRSRTFLACWHRLRRQPTKVFAIPTAFVLFVRFVFKKNCVICETRSGHFQLISCGEQKKRPISCVVKKKVLLLHRLSEKEKATAPSEGAMQKFFGRLAQLVQSICLTSRGSAVRIRQRPPNNIPFHKDYYEGIHS